MSNKAYDRFIDQELLIRYVQDKPAIWNKTLEIYKDKIAKKAAWREICLTLKDDFKVMKPTERHMFERSVIKKWTHTRDAWIRSIKERMKSTKSGTSVPRIKPYKYHDQMLFLEKVVAAEETHENIRDSIDTTETKIQYKTYYEEPSQIISEPSSSETKRVELKYAEKSPKQKTRIEEDRNLTFFKSILPSLVSFNDDEILELHSGVINLVRSIKSARCDRPDGDWSSCAQSSSTPQGYCGMPNYPDPLTMKLSPSPESSTSQDSE